MGTLPPLSMPTGGQFASLFPPILDLQTHEAITDKAAALKAGTAAPPAFAVPDLETPEPAFVLEDIDGDGAQGGRVLGALVDGYDSDGETDRESTRVRLRDMDIWVKAGQPAPEERDRAFELRNWDTPATPSPFRPRGPAVAFDSLSIQTPEPITLPPLRSPAAIPPTDATSLLDYLVDTTLIAPPPGVRWSRSKNRYTYDAKRGERTAAGFVEEILAVATAVRRLETVANDDSPSLTPTHQAFLNALYNVVDYMRHRLTDMEGTTAQQATLWLTRSQALEDVALLGNAMCDLVLWPLSEPKAIGLPARPSSLLTHVYNHLAKRLETRIPSHQHVTLCLAYLLERSTKPWLDVLHLWIGVADSSRADEDMRPESQPWEDLGITRQPLPPVNGHARWEYEFAPRRMPVFIPPDVRRTFFEGGRSLRALREASGGMHPLCWTDWPIKACWGWGNNKEPEYDLRFHARRVQREIDKWRTTMIARQPRSRAISVSSMSSMRRRQDQSVPASPHQQSAPSAPLSPTAQTLPENIWLAAAQSPPPRPLVDFISAPSKTPLWRPTPDDLEAFLDRHSDPSHPLLPRGSTLEDYISSHLLASPLAHATLISRALVSHYLDDLHFLDHLDVLHAFWLGGDAGFTERVSLALFGKDGGENADAVGLGRRARTRARLGIGSTDATPEPSSMQRTPTPGALDTPAATTPNSSVSMSQVPEWGIGLGIGLSDRKRWPPGGAELAYALRTTLFDHDIARFKSRGPVWRGIEDRVSFALRALPEDESDGRRAKWLNPQAIEALDFLYLAYSPPAGIAPLLPSAIMDKYQVVHNLLLRLSRVDAVLRGLYFDILRPDSSQTQVQNKTGVDSHHSRYVSPLNKPTVHLPLLGVFEYDSPTAKDLRYLRFMMSWFVTAFTRYVLDTVGHNCAVMHRRLSSLRRGAPAASGAVSREPSRPATPAWMILEDDELYFSEGEGAGADDSQAQLATISQLQSAHSLVLYHHIILNRVLRACLLSPGSAHAFGTLMSILGLVLDFGKAVKEIERGLLGPRAGADVVRHMREQWEDSYPVFIKAVERLSRMRPERDDSEDADDSGDEADLQILLGEGAKGRSTDLRELLLRLKLGQGSGIIVKWEEERRKEREAQKRAEKAEKEGKRAAAGAAEEAKLEAQETPKARPALLSSPLSSLPSSSAAPGSSPVRPSSPPAPPSSSPPPPSSPPPSDSARQVPRTPPTQSPRTPPAAASALPAEIELADELELAPPPIVHETIAIKRAQQSPLKGTLPARLGQLQALSRPQPERSRSDDEISLD